MEENSMRFTLDYDQYAALARQTAAEGCVLLKNEKEALPIRKGETVSVFGRIAFTYYKSGTGSGGMVNAPYVTNILDSLKECKDISVNEELEAVYQDWIRENPFDMGEGWAQEPWSQKEMPVSEALAKKAAASSDLAVVVLGRTAGEDMDNSAEPGSYLLTAEEEALIKTVCSAFKRTAVVLNVGNIIDMKWVDRYQPQAVLYVWQGGQEGGHAAADILTGAVNPCGKLSDTIAADISDYPSTDHFGDAVCNVYAEDIYVGYRYFETFAKEKVSYPFGFGLSYTDFSVEVLNTRTDGMKAELTVLVKNIGKTAGKEVVQVYVCPPQGKLGKPVRNLNSFYKTQLLTPGEGEEVNLVVSLEKSASYDDSGVTGEKSCWVLEAGAYGIYVGTDVRSAKKVCEVQLDELCVISRLEEALAPVQPYERLVPVETGKKGTDGEPVLEIGKQAAPLRSVDLAERIRTERPEAEACIGDQGWKLADVCDKKVTLEQFLSQLSDEDLACLVRGEGMCSPKATPGIASAFGGVTDSLKAFGIPVAGCSDGPSGIRMDCGTIAFSLPNGTLLACTFNPELVEQLYEMEGMELRKNQIDTLLGPGMNIHRNPLNGRNFEYFSEDPCVAGTMAAAQLKGMGKYGVTGTIKHFAGNNQEFKRHDANGIVSERALREIYLKGFEIAVKEGHAYSIMSTYGPINGIWTAGSYDLLTTILRKDWGYQGVVMTDWWAKMNEEGEEGSQSNTIPMVRAQNDVYMVVSDSASNSANDNTMEGLADGRLTRGQLVRNAKNICHFLMRSPVMNRFCDREFDVCEEINNPAKDAMAGNLIASQKVEKETKLDLTKLSTQKGVRAGYLLDVSKAGSYQMIFKMHSGENPFAQLPVSIFINGVLQQTTTFNGTDNKIIERAVTISFPESGENQLTLFFGESGVRMDEILLVQE